MIISGSDTTFLLVLEFLSAHEDSEINEVNYTYGASRKSFTEITHPKKIVVLTLPGAFTPTCTHYHLPAFEEKYETLKSLGIEEIYILVNNDLYVTREWANSMKIKNCKFICDTELNFAKKYDNLLYRANLGVRNRREIFVFDKNAVLEKRFSEVYKADSDDPYEETTCEKLIEYLESVKQ